jgi:hypothetical protein
MDLYYDALSSLTTAGSTAYRAGDYFFQDPREAAYFGRTLERTKPGVRWSLHPSEGGMYRLAFGPESSRFCPACLMPAVLPAPAPTVTARRRQLDRGEVRRA